MANQESEWLDKSLEAIFEFLNSNGFACLLTPENDPILRSRHLMIGLGQDAKNREYILKINFLLVPKPADIGLEELPFSEKAFMQFVVALPFKGKEKHGQELLRMMAQLNATIEIPGFGCNEVLSELHFRYVYFSYESRLHKAWLLTLIVYIRALLDFFGSWIEEVALGHITVDEIAAKWKNADIKDFPTLLKSLNP